MVRALRGWMLLSGLISILFNTAAAASPSVAFYYGNKLPVSSFSVFDWVVVEPGNVTTRTLGQLKDQGAEAFAYLSVGEVARSRPWHGELNREWILGENPAWASDIMDLRSDGWRGYLIGKRMQALWNQGYRAFFLDTMDSYHAVSDTDAERETQRQSLATVIRQMHERFPGVKLLFNRGFEILDDVTGLVAGVAAESLYQGWNPTQQRYREVPAQDREWLSARLREVTDKHGLPAIAIDYTDPADKPLARSTAEKIVADGFIPWVSTPELDRVGTGSITPISRRVLLIYSSRFSIIDYTEVHRFVATPLEAMGYAVDYLDIAQPLPAHAIDDRYVGMVSWLSGIDTANAQRYRDWFKQQMRAGLPIAVLSNWGFEPDPEISTHFRLRPLTQAPKPPLTQGEPNPAMGFEAPARALAAKLPGWGLTDAADAVSWFPVVDSTGTRFDPVTISSAGGAAFYPYVIDTADGLDAWVIDPFAFLKAALKLPDMPAPDLTTENGSRYLTAHIDGDGFYNVSFTSGNRYAAEVVFEDIIEPSPLPHTFSIVEGEIGPTGVKPELSAKMETIARRIFRADNVELASHTYAHPFHWGKAMKARKTNYAGIRIPEGGGKTVTYKLSKKADVIPHLAIPGYRYSPEREVKGSIDYINRELAPPGKKAKVMLWSGTALPNTEDLAWAEKIGVVNMNGGDTTITRDKPFITHVSASGRPSGPYFQVYAPIQNENIYTNEWLGPHWGFIRAIESYKLTDKPRRLKPISIYYHSYSGDYPSSIKALGKVYQWAMKQDIQPLYVSEYSPVVTDYQSIGLARNLDGAWLMRGQGHVRTLRIAPHMGWPDLQRSTGVAGVRDLPQGRYLHLIPGQTLKLFLSENPPTRPHLLRSNARLLHWSAKGDRIRFHLKGYLPVELDIGGSRRCQLQLSNGERLEPSRQQGIQSFRLNGTDSGDATLICS